MKDAMVTSFKIMDYEDPHDPWERNIQVLSLSYVTPTGLERFYVQKVKLFKEMAHPLQRYIDLFRGLADALETDRAENINREPEELEEIQQ